MQRTMQVTKGIVGLAVVLVAVFGVLALSQQTAPSGAPEVAGGIEPPVITFVAVSGDPGRYRALADAFNAQRADVRVVIRDIEEVIPFDSTLPAAQWPCALATAADVFSYDFDPAAIAGSGAALDLQLLLDRHADFDTADLFPGLLDSYRAGGGLWGIPAAVHPRVVFYNRKLFDAAGVAYPRPGWTRDEFLNAALALTNRAAGVWGFAEPFRYGGAASFAYLHAGALDVDGRPVFDNPLAAEALAWYADLARVHQVMPGPDSPDAPKLDGGNGLPALGRAAMWSGFLEQGRFADTGIAPLPGDRSGATLASVAGYFVSSGTKNPEAAWQWIDFLTRQSPGPMSLPVRQSVLESEAYRSQAGDETHAVYRYLLERLPARPWPSRYAWYNAAFSWLADEGLPALMRGASDVQSVAAEAQSRAQTALIDTSSVSCSSIVVEDPTPAPEAAVHLTLHVNLFPPGVYEALADDYGIAHPGVRVNVTEDESAVDISDVVATSSDSLFNGWPDAPLDVQPLVDADPSLDLNDFYPQALEAFRKNGDLYGLPTEIDALLLFYDKGLFDAAGVPYPQPGWTWDDVLDAAKQLTRGEGANQQWGFATFFYDWARLPLVRAAQQGSGAVNGCSPDADPTLNDPALVEAVRWLVDLYEVHRVTPARMVHYTDWEQVRAFHDSGKIAMWIGSISTFNYYEPRYNWGAVPLPTNGRPGTYFSFGGYTISARTAHPRESWELLKYLARQSGDSLSARRSLADQATFSSYLETSRAELRRALEMTLAGYVELRCAPGILPAWAEWQGAVHRLYRKAIQRVFDDGLDPAQALEAAQAKAETYVACVDQGGGGEACEKEAEVPPAVPFTEE